jgi:hypothetical protein
MDLIDGSGNAVQSAAAFLSLSTPSGAPRIYYFHDNAICDAELTAASTLACRGPRGAKLRRLSTGNYLVQFENSRLSSETPKTFYYLLWFRQPVEATPGDCVKVLGERKSRDAAPSQADIDALKANGLSFKLRSLDELERVAHIYETEYKARGCESIEGSTVYYDRSKVVIDGDNRHVPAFTMSPEDVDKSIRKAIGL